MAINLTAGGAGTNVDIAGRNYTLGANDTFNIQVKMPSTTPYLGLGWGQKQGSKGWGFHADLGVSIGKFKVSESRTGELANGGQLNVTQPQVDQEMADVRDSVAKLKFWPPPSSTLPPRFSLISRGGLHINQSLSRGFLGFSVV